MSEPLLETVNRLLYRYDHDPGFGVREFTAALVEASATEEVRIRVILDQHLPTIITGLDYAVRPNQGKGRDELDTAEVGLRAALSSAHWIAKGVAGLRVAPLYDLPSVQDLMDTTRKLTTERDRLDGDRYDDGAVAMARHVTASREALAEVRAENPFRNRRTR